MHSPLEVSPIVLLRCVRKLSQTDLAELSGLSRETIVRLERGEQPRLDTARAVAAAFGVSIASLFPEERERPAGQQRDALEVTGGRAGHDEQ